MSEERARILGLLAEGKITADEAERLLDALGDGPTPTAAHVSGNGGSKLPEGLPKYLFVKVLSADGDNVDVKVPLALVRSGLKLTSLIPPQAMDQVNESMGEHGMQLDFSNLKPEDIDELIEALREMEVNVDAANGDNVRVFCG
jgi:hypothetical protein